jgi:dTMP kinase
MKNATRSGAIICFMGIDGSGKSTLAKALYRELQNQGIQCTYLWWLQAENSLLRRTLRKVLTGKGPTHTRPLSKQRLMDAHKKQQYAYQMCVLLDYLRQLVTRVIVPVSFGKTVICDRYIYDTVIAFAIEFGYSEPRLDQVLKIVESVSPSPDVLFIVDVPIEIAFSRKGDITDPDSLRIPKKTYLEMSKKMSACLLDGTRDLESLSKDVLSEVEKRLGRRR